VIRAGLKVILKYSGRQAISSGPPFKIQSFKILLRQAIFLLKSSRLTLTFSLELKNANEDKKHTDRLDPGLASNELCMVAEGG
jgi:hypothetical protein